MLEMAMPEVEVTAEVQIGVEAPVVERRDHTVIAAIVGTQAEDEVCKAQR